MIDLYVRDMVSLFWPHDLPASALRMLRRFLAFVWMLSMWWRKVKCVSKVTPRSFGDLLRGRRSLLMYICGW